MSERNRQFEKLVELMEANPNMAKGLGQFGSSKKSQKEYWESFAIELNSLGPTVPEGNEWHKVWLDYKRKLKNKFASNRKEVTATGGGPFSSISLSPLEKAVDSLLSLQNAIDPPGRAFGASEETSEQHDVEEELEYTAVHVISLPMAMAISSRVSRKDTSHIDNAKLKMLEGQTSVQKELLETSKSIHSAILDIARYTRKSYELKKEKLVLLRDKEMRMDKENIDKNRRHKENTGIQLRKLEIKSLMYQNAD